MNAVTKPYKWNTINDPNPMSTIARRKKNYSSFASFSLPFSPLRGGVLWFLWIVRIINKNHEECYACAVFFIGFRYFSMSAFPTDIFICAAAYLCYFHQFASVIKRSLNKSPVSYNKYESVNMTEESEEKGERGRRYCSNGRARESK